MASNNPSFQFDLYSSNRIAKTYPTKLAIPLATFETPPSVEEFKAVVSFVITSDITLNKAGDTYEFINYKRTLNGSLGYPDTIAYSQNKTNIIAYIDPIDNPYGTYSSNRPFFTKTHYNLVGNEIQFIEGYTSIELLKLGEDDLDVIDGLDISLINPAHDYLLYLLIDIPMVGFNLNCDVIIHEFNSSSGYPYSTFGDRCTIYPYSTIGYYDDGVVYIPDTGDNELYIGEH